MIQEKIIDKIKKLLALSKSSNEHEAANAAARAAELMAEHQIAEASIRVEDETHVAEPIQVERIYEARKRIAWKGALAHALADSLGAKMFWSGGDIRIFGRTSAIQTISYMLMYFSAEIERLCRSAWIAESVGDDPPISTQTTWKNAFRLGAAGVIAQRLREQAHAEKGRRDHVTAVVAPSSTMSRALVLVRKDEIALEDDYARYRTANGFRKTPAIGRVSSCDGYSAGREAGRGVSLGGNARGLKAPAPRLK